MSAAIKEIDCLPSYVCSYTHLIKIFLSCISRVVAMDITSILKHVVEITSHRQPLCLECTNFEPCRQ